MFRRDIFDDEHIVLRKQVSDFLDMYIVPFHDTWSQNQTAPTKIWREAGAQRLLCRGLPSEFGGAQKDFRDSVIIIEEIAKRRLPGCLLFLQSDIIAPFLHQVGKPAQREKWLPKICSGQSICALAMTEAQSGSDLFSLDCSAEWDGDKFILNGVKTHISNGSTADIILVAARSKKTGLDGRPGFTLLVLEGDPVGLTREKISKSAMRALDTATLRFENIRVPKENLLGVEGMGFLNLFTFLSIERLVLSVFAQAATEAQLTELIAFCHARKTVAGTVLDFQNTQFALADLYAECAVNRTFVDQCIAGRLKAEADPRAGCIAKLRTTETQKKVAALGVQLRGASGLSGDEGKQAIKDLTDSSAQSIWGGSSEVMRDIIGRSLANLF
ncbi:Acyl-CoA dehydrogenase [Pseudovibrio sp. W64]|uniref:acyl-CoA dehydrogenase family protein n=1 Tax=Pseudovibrio TaxID=258255 RepID=UPI0007AE9A68|nr:acyl-CoA dehydrogenase family protein [Pseudovibrio sp. W64]KZK87657.1 Acyl-CoA dehydrogenase [Pseudovibrio sp. W64]